ncbi:ATP-binding protein [Arcticibacterium luteifluviistationis]|uniref:histidine kinase n=1 Tax=Arcticibacterium luteifluviistationis TaxID=1784714 RepID=A0A2Z4GEX4_9BACT|nr:ATP-binding protein [Arcticibacterium luteifluviistationis]AWV99538.1 histidine kinase [Arcticibacterium luteifluviistationis]
MIPIDKTVAKRLTGQYIVALSIVAILTICGHTLIQFTLLDVSDNSHVVNLAGRQRMLSQRLTKLYLLKTHASEAWDEESQVSFEQSFSNWKKTHIGLRDNELSDEKRYEVNNSKKINTMFKEIDPFFKNMESLFGGIMDGRSLPNSEVLALLQNEKDFLKTMDKIVYQYDHEATQRVAILRAFEFLILFLTLLTLFVEFIFIFNPLANYVEGVIGELTSSEQNLLAANNQLSVSNKMLLKTQEDLYKATQEKYENKRKQDQVRSAYLLEGQEEERKRMSREIHDGLGQMLTGIKLSLGRLNSPDMDPKLRRAYEHMKQLTNETIEATRAISFNLMPTALNDFGIVSALKIFVHQAQNETDLQFSIEVSSPEKRYTQNMEINIYRIVQEAINNIIKHASATVAKVKMHENNGLLELSITDNGKGFDPEKLKAERQSLIHNGLENIKMRVTLLNGTFRLTTLEGEGTDIFIKLPFESIE